MTKKNSVELSLRRSETVRGYEIRRLPLGEYLAVAQMLRDLPQKLLAACFPEGTLSDALGALRTADAEKLLGLLANAMQVMPQEMVRVLAGLTGVEESALLSDPDIGLDGAAEMLLTFWRLNGMENFMQAAGCMAAQVRKIRTGFSA